MRAFATLIFLLVCWDAASEERFALLVGNSRYEHATSLRNPENDIAIVAKSLEAVGFLTTQVANADSEAISRAVRRFVAEVRHKKRPVVLVYFAGHGIQRNGQNYLLPVDASVADPESLQATALSVGWLIDQLSSVDASFRIVVLDACRDDPFEQKDRGAAGLRKGLAQVAEGSGQFVAFSTAPGKTAEDGDSGTSAYASAFAESILISGLTARAVFDRVREKVHERTEGRQEPWESAATYGDFFFVPPTTSVHLSDEEAVMWDTVALLDSAEAYHKYIVRYPNGRFAVLAKQIVANINKDFSFRKQAEAFPVLSWSSEGGTIDFCGKAASSTMAQFNLFSQFDGQLVYVDLFFPRTGVLCQKVGDSYPLVTEHFSSGKCMETYIGDVWGQNKNLTCIPKRPAKLFGVESQAFADRDGFLSIDGRIYLSTQNSEYYTFEINMEEDYFWVKGLVRVRGVIPVNDYQMYLEPVNPAELGLSWKYQNTLHAYKGGSGSDSGLKVIDLRRGRPFKEWSGSTDDDTGLAGDQRVDSYWTYDGSLMEYQTLDSGDPTFRRIVYRKPAPKAGAAIKVGTVAFEGQMSSDMRLSGVAYYYRPPCRPVISKMTGGFSDDLQQIVLTGELTTLDARCELRSRRNSTLIFELVHDQIEMVEQRSRPDDHDDGTATAELTTEMTYDPETQQWSTGENDIQDGDARCFVLSGRNKTDDEQCEVRHVEGSLLSADGAIVTNFVWPSGGKTVLVRFPDRLEINGVRTKEVRRSGFGRCYLNSRSQQEFCVLQ